MRHAAPASVSIHVGLIAGAFLFLNLEPAIDETAAESVSIEIISMDAVAANPTDEITEATETLVSAGAVVEAEEMPETVEPEAAEVAEAEPARAVLDVANPLAVAEVEPSDGEEVASAEVMTAAPDLVTPVEAAMPQMVSAAATVVADSVQPSQSDPLEAVRNATIGQLTRERPAQPLPKPKPKPAEVTRPVETASLAPVVEEELQVAPIPRPRIVRKPAEAKAEHAKERPKKAEQPTEKQPQKKPPSKQASLGNGGRAEADSAAGKSGGGAGKSNDGGSAAASKYPGLIQAKVTRAAKYPSKARGEAGEALVSFTVGAGGKVMQVALARSSGNAALDKAALAAVDRAAPFPPIPEAAGRSSWSFTVPVYFKK